MKEAAGIDDDLDITLNVSETPKATRRSGTCFNCGGPHTLAECTIPHDRRKINRNRQSFGSTKRDRITTEQVESKYKPGKLSTAAMEALGLHDDEYPQWIYRMRDEGPIKGYPPAFLKRLQPEEKRLSFICDDPTLTSEVPKVALEFDREKIVYYDGFNIVDASCAAETAANKNVRREFRWPAYTEESYSREMEKYLKNPENSPRRKRHHENDSQQQQPAKRGRFDAYETPQGRPPADRPSTHTVFADEDTPRSPDLPPVISRALTEDQATPKNFLVPVVDDRKMPDKNNFAVGITPFQYDNEAKRTNTMDKLEQLIKSVKKE
jgi:hypothetical protein